MVIYLLFGFLTGSISTCYCPSDLDRSWFSSSRNTKITSPVALMLMLNQLAKNTHTHCVLSQVFLAYRTKVYLCAQVRFVGSINCPESTNMSLSRNETFFGAFAAKAEQLISLKPPGTPTAQSPLTSARKATGQSALLYL